MMKIRLAGGPFNGKVLQGDGRNEIIMTGPKKMRREDEWQWRLSDPLHGAYRPKPRIEARYRIAMRMQGIGTTVVNAPCQHPDGSVFYEFVKGSKREVG